MKFLIVLCLSLVSVGARASMECWDQNKTAAESFGASYGYTINPNKTNVRQPAIGVKLYELCDDRGIAMTIRIYMNDENDCAVSGPEMYVNPIQSYGCSIVEKAEAPARKRVRTAPRAARTKPAQSAGRQPRGSYQRLSCSLYPNSPGCIDHGSSYDNLMCGLYPSTPGC